MNPLQIALLACQIAGTVWPMFEPLAAKGLNALIADLHAAESSKKSLSYEEIKTLADKHGVNMGAVLDYTKGSILALKDAHIPVAAGHRALSFSSFFSDIVASVVSLRNFFASPETAAAVANIEAMAGALICDIGAISGLTEEIMQQVGAGQSTIGTTNKVNVASNTICAAMKGNVVGTASGTVNALTAPLAV